MEYYSSKYKHAYLYGEINEANVAPVIKIISEYNKNFEKQIMKMINDPKNKKKNSFIKSEPIVLHLNSPGGNVKEGILLANMLSQSRIPIYVLVEGICMSAATFITVMAKKRIMLNNSVFLIHQPSQTSRVDAQIKLDEKQFQTNALLNAYKIGAEIYKNYTSLSEKQIKKLLNHDKFLTPTQAKKYNLIDEIVTPVAKSVHKTKETPTIVYITDIDEDSKEYKESEIFKDNNAKCLFFMIKLQRAIYRHTFPIILKVSELYYFGGLFEVLPIINIVSLFSNNIYSVIESPITLYSLLYCVQCKKRIMYKYAYVMIDLVHEYYYEFMKSKLEDNIENTKIVKEIIIGILEKNTKIPKKILSKIFTKRFLFNSAECLEYGIVDKVYGEKK